MTDIHTGTYGAKRQSSRRASPRDILLKLIKQQRSASEAELRQMFTEKVIDDHDQLDAIIEYWFANNYRSLTAPVRKAPEPQEKEVIAAKKEEWKEIAVRKITAGVLDMVVNGKAIRDYTFSEIGKLGGKFIALSKGGKPNEKVGKLSETAVRKLFR